MDVCNLLNPSQLQISSQRMRLRQLHVKMGLCSLNNDPLDFKNNYANIIGSIQECKRLNCAIRIGGELEVPGYGCDDHFLEYDTTFHSWDVIRDIIKSGVTDGIVCDIGCPVLHKAALYNGRVIIYNSKVIAIRVKMILADGGNYFETRYFANWKHSRQIADFLLPKNVQEVTGQLNVPIGVFILNFNDTSLAYQICEEAWISNNPMIDAALDGAEIFVNASASEIQRGKLGRKIQMISEFTERHGGAYAYVNIRGSHGGRNYFDGCCMFTENGKCKKLSEPFHLDNYSVTPVVINLNSVRTFRLNNKSFQKQSHGTSKIPRVKIDIDVAHCAEDYLYDSPEHKDQLRRLRQIYETSHATFQPSAFLWDILRKSKARGFFLPLSGGLDSCSVAVIVYNMCYLIFQEITERKSEQVLADLRRILRDKSYEPESPHEICGKILFTCYMGTENSSNETKKRAKTIAAGVGCHHREMNFDNIYKSYQEVVNKQFELEAKFKKDGGSNRTDLALQNIQSRSRMVLSYFMASMELEKTSLEGFLLILGSSNLDESLRGYFTKYDCSSADYNPIGSFSKNRLKQVLRFFARYHQFGFITQVLNANPTAELRPLNKGEIAQTDQEDMGLSYYDLGLFGHLRKVEKLGPVSMFDRIYFMKKYDDVQELSDKIKKFFTYYGINRHKCTTTTPSFHYEPESCDDNRFDMRPFLYATDWSYQFDIIDERVKSITEREQELRESAKIQPNLRKKSFYSFDPNQDLYKVNFLTFDNKDQSSNASTPLKLEGNEPQKFSFSYNIEDEAKKEKQ